MKRRLFQLLARLLFRKKKNVLIIASVFLMAVPIQADDESPPIAQDTTVPNEFGFMGNTFYVRDDATNATVSVYFIPGNRSYSGSVDYYTSNGTAIAGIDYEQKSGTLTFSGGYPAPVITIPVYKNELRQTNLTVELFLTNSSASITEPQATLIILNKGERPLLQMSRTAYGTILLWWPPVYEEFVLEKNLGLSNTNWGEVEVAPRMNYCVISEPETEAPVFFRLKKKATP